MVLGTSCFSNHFWHCLRQSQLTQGKYRPESMLAIKQYKLPWPSFWTWNSPVYLLLYMCLWVFSELPLSPDMLGDILSFSRLSQPFILIDNHSAMNHRLSVALFAIPYITRMWFNTHSLILLMQQTAGFRTCQTFITALPIRWVFLPNHLSNFKTFLENVTFSSYGWNLSEVFTSALPCILWSQTNLMLIKWQEWMIS